MGKRCWIKGTKILLWNGNIKNVEEIKIGDILIGDDGTQREVLNLCSGEDEMYKIYQFYDMRDSKSVTFKKCLKTRTERTA